ncbi:4-hydroxy-tetrahydrodipicolinate synthase [Thermovenabulum gondwanense]|uniref:4-hydroxy-tetrahydrodipicolinate synthase n=1 Tax=Thermovenabulum gondwanense TaxID=520767 RepID=A0A162MSY5_9FIRM|nr:4-hydroxy-tetrahydrodipicolinate synthase [Thermovenabulum gondwanense]KYO67263.1 4-hydroxy-tetrahydrodipicolinate synthase [Thermovenabulum gondwanense]
MDFGKVITAAVTPFDDELKVDYDAFQKLIDYLIENGSDSIVVSGTTGESPTLTDEEKLKLYRAAVEVSGQRAKIIAGTGSNNTEKSIELSIKAQELGVDGLLLVAPYYNKPTQEGLYRHFKMIAESVKIPCMLYNVPGRTSVNIEPETVARLSEVKNIVALKDAGGNLDKTSLTKILAPKIDIYSGDDSMTLPMLSIGAKGVVSVASHIAGKEIKEMIESFERGELKKALDLHLKLFDLFKTLFIITNPIPVKEALNQMGIKVGGLRPPLCEADEKTKRAVSECLKALNKI